MLQGQAVQRMSDTRRASIGSSPFKHMEEQPAGLRQRGAGLLSLPTTVLEAIAALLDLQTRAGVLPLVCSAFHHLLSGPSACLWPDISFEADISQLAQRARAHQFLPWLRRHGRHSRTLQLDLWNGGLPPPPADEVACKLLGQRLEDTLQATLQSCEFLRLRWGGFALVAGDWLATATSLTCLAFSAHELRVKQPLGAITSLVHLELSTVEDIGPLFDPGCLPLSLTRLCCVPAPAKYLEEVEGNVLVPAAGATSEIPEQVLALPRLEYLDVSESVFGGEHLAAALPRLAHLTSLALDKCELPGGMPRELSLLVALRVLSLDGCSLHGSGGGELAPAWTVLSRLSRLVSLSISNCLLARFPEPLAAMTSVQHLYLEHNAIRVLPPGPFWRGLRVLSTDWEPLLRSHALLRQAPHLRKLALGCQSVVTHNEEGLPPVAEVPDLLDSLRHHPGLQQVVLVARPGHVHGAIFVVLEAVLCLRGVRPGLEVLPIQHDSFFVEEPPKEEEEAAQQQLEQQADQQQAQQQQAAVQRAMAVPS